MKIYTKKGDRGETYLFGGGPYPKDNLRVQAYGTVDELNSVLGLVSVELEDSKLSKSLLRVQKELFVLGSELASVHPGEELMKGFLQRSHIHRLEKSIDEWEESLPPLTHFILPGGTRAAAQLHFARCVCRRAERAVVSLSHQEEVRPEVIEYLNRLSDWLFVFARLVNHKRGQNDVIWEGLLS